MTRLISVLVLLGMFGAASGCYATRPSAPFNVAAKNVGTERLESVKIEFDGFWHSMGFLGPGGGGSQYSLFEGRWPKTAKVTWRFEDDRPYMPDREAVVVVPPRPTLGPEEDLTLWFELDDEHVTVRVEKVDLTWIREHMRNQDRERDRLD